MTITRTQTGGGAGDGDAFIDRKITCRVLEAKNLSSDRAKICDPYVAVALDGAEQLSPTVYNNNNPFWSEEFTFGSLGADFSQLAVVVQHRLPDSKAAPLQLGQVVFPKPLLISGQLEEEQWFALTPCDLENAVSGDVRVKMAYFPPKDDIKTHTYAVNVISARNLSPRSASGSADPFVVLHLLPDRRIKSTQATTVKRGALSPHFNETFIFVVDDVRPDLELHIAVWHSVGEGSDDIFMGHSSIPIGDVQNGLKSDRWYTLLSKPAHIENLSSGVGQSKWSRRSTQLLNKPRRFVHALQTAGSDSSSFISKAKKPHKLVDTKLNSLTYCGHCSGIMWALSAQMQCKECKFNCHVKCAKFVTGNCGSVSMIRVKVKYQITPILSLARYEPTIKLLAENDFSLAILLGSSIPEREEYASCLINIFDYMGVVESFLSAVVSSEVREAANVPTLFRANSLASKAIDVFMKHVGLDFLQSVLGPLISDIIREKKFCEVDPTRLEKKDNLSQSWKNLTSYFSVMIDRIFGSLADFPKPLRRVFYRVQQDVKQRFPEDPDSTIVSVSGFVFLRFFAPAVLGPKLFGLTDVYLDASTSRTLTLLAKSLQNLANLVEFGQKEPYMLNMNSVITARMQDMRAFIDNVSSLKGIQPIPAKSTKVDKKTAGLRCASLYEMVLKASSGLTEGIKEQNRSNVKLLLQQLSEITSAIEQISCDQKRGTQKIKLSSDASDAAPDASAMPPNKSEEEVTAVLKEAKDRRPSALSTQSAATLPGSPKLAPNSRAPTISREGTIDSQNQSMLRDFPRISALGESVEPSPATSKRTSAFEPMNTLDVVMAEALAAGHLKKLETLIIPEHPIPLNNSFEDTPLQSPSSASASLDTSRTATVTAPAEQKSSSPTTTQSVTDSPTTSTKKAAMGRQQMALMQLQLALAAASNASLQSLGDCDSCKQAVTSLVDVHRFEGKMWHKQHFVCSKCKTSLVTQPATLLSDGLFCQQHLPQCFACELPISDSFVQAMDRNWHQDCFVCAGCEIPLTTNYLPLDGLPFCRPCYLRQSGLTCGGCGEFIETDYVEIFGQKYHVNCKKCDQCGETLAGKHFFKLNGQVLCSSHRTELINCHSCNSRIDGQVLVALQKQYQFHPEHFNCAICKKNLVNMTFQERNDQPLCQNCCLQQTMIQLQR